MEYQASGIQGEFMTYQGKPLVREGNIILYGDMTDPYCLQMMILTEKDMTVGGKTEKVPDHIIVQVLSTDASKPYAQRLEKQFEKNGLFEALDIGMAWLEKLNKKK